jgi:hypothetical protein
MGLRVKERERLIIKGRRVSGRRKAITTFINNSWKVVAHLYRGLIFRAG